MHECELKTLSYTQEFIAKEQDKTRDIYTSQRPANNFLFIDLSFVTNRCLLTSSSLIISMCLAQMFD